LTQPGLEPTIYRTVGKRSSLFRQTNHN